MERFGWAENAGRGTPKRQAFETANPRPPADPVREVWMDSPPGYPRELLARVDRVPPEGRPLGTDVAMAAGLSLDGVVGGEDPWCCFVSCLEPHDPFVCGEEAFALFDPATIELPPTTHDDLADRPGLYRRAAERFHFLSDADRRFLTACYFASIVEIDRRFGRLLDRLEAAGELDDTLVVLTSDHGEMLGAHGLWMKNVGAFEEVYHVPLVVAGPGVAGGRVSSTPAWACTTCARRCASSAGPSRSRTPTAAASRREVRGDADFGGFASGGFDTGYAEFEGTRQRWTQRIVWDDRGGGRWKLVHNGFDFDELYDLTVDPHETRNLAHEPNSPRAARGHDAADVVVRGADRRPHAGEHALPGASAGGGGPEWLTSPSAGAGPGGATGGWRWATACSNARGGWRAGACTRSR